MADKSYRVLLPADVEPEHYDLTLEPDLEAFFFNGVVKITCDVVEATEKISVHAVELLISSATFTPAEGGSFPANEISTKVKDMTATMTFDEVLPVGKGVLEIHFRGVLNDKMAGFYRSSYTDSKGVKRCMATTQFEAIDARRCFPCWDEPARKATFGVTLVYPADLTAISNMPASRSELQKDGRRRDVYMPTPKMSTYLLAFCIGEFEYISGKTKGGTMARIFCCHGSISKCHYALKVCIKALDFYNEYFGIPYPLPKLDMIAIPDFAAGAMENWGLVTYREVALLCDEEKVSTVQKQRICSVIAHELAHQWFGNLVTMGWWDDLWLNEGFANWMQTFATDVIHPEWNLWQSYVGMEQQQALNLDALRSSHPIQVPIKRAEEVEEVFDAISYCKGGSVVRMVHAVLGPEKFQEGLRAYFQRHKYGNTETTDLWKAWADVSGKPVKDMMASWTGQMGFPVLKVLAEPTGAEVEVEQAWFIADGSSQPEDAAKTWMVPVLVGTSGGQAPIVFLKEKKQKLTFDGVAGASWIKLNYGQHMPCRVLYPPGMLKKLSDNMQSLPAEDRIGLLADSYALVKNGALEPMSLLTLLKGFKGELNDKVWAELASCLGGLARVVIQGLPEATSKAFCAFAAQLVIPAWEKVGWDAKPGDDDNQKRLRGILAGLVAKYCFKDAALVQEAQKRLKRFIEDPASPDVLHADIRIAVLSLAMRGGADPEAVFNQLTTAHEAADSKTRLDIYAALGASPTMALKKKALDYALGEHVRSQDLYNVPAYVVQDGKEGAEATFQWMQDGYDTIAARVGASSMILFNHVVRISGSGFVTQEKATMVEDFWKSKELYKMIQKTLNQTVEGIKNNAVLVDRLLKSDVSKPEAWAL